VSVVRLFLAVWLVAFAAQATDLIATVIPDDCVEDARGSAADPCPDECARCVCCARVPIFVPPVAAPGGGHVMRTAQIPSPIERPTDPLPRGILHVPKAR
jgi:hypothetical protein